MFVIYYYRVITFITANRSILKLMYRSYVGVNYLTASGVNLSLLAALYTVTCIILGCLSRVHQLSCTLQCRPGLPLFSAQINETEVNCDQERRCGIVAIIV